MLYVIWGFFSLIVFFLYPMFFSTIEMVGLSSASFFFKIVFSSIVFGGFALVFMAMLMQGGA